MKHFEGSARFRWSSCSSRGRRRTGSHCTTPGRKRRWSTSSLCSRKTSRERQTISLGLDTHRSHEFFRQTERRNRFDFYCSLTLNSHCCALGSFSSRVVFASTPHKGHRIISSGPVRSRLSSQSAWIKNRIVQGRLRGLQIDVSTSRTVTERC